MFEQLVAEKLCKFHFFQTILPACSASHGWPRSRRSRHTHPPPRQRLPWPFLQSPPRRLAISDHMHPALTPCSATMVAFALTASTATLFRRTSILPATTSVRAFPPCAVGSVRRRSSAPASWGATTVRAMAESIKAPASVTLSDEEWRTKLSPEQFHILRQKGTEMGGTGEYNKFQPPAGFFKVCADGDWSVEDESGTFGRQKFSCMS